MAVTGSLLPVDLQAHHGEGAVGRGEHHPHHRAFQLLGRAVVGHQGPPGVAGPGRKLAGRSQL